MTQTFKNGDCRVQYGHVKTGLQKALTKFALHVSDSKALAKRNASHRKSTQVLLLALTCIPFGHPLAFTCEDLRRPAFDLNMFKFWTQVRPTCVSFGHSTQVDASFRKSFQLCWKPLANLMPLFEQESQTISRLSRFPF